MYFLQEIVIITVICSLSLKKLVLFETSAFVRTKLTSFCCRRALQITNKLIFLAICLWIISRCFWFYIPVFRCVNVNHTHSIVVWWIVWWQFIRTIIAFIGLAVFALVNMCLKLGEKTLNCVVCNIC